MGTIFTTSFVRLQEGMVVLTQPIYVAIDATEHRLTMIIFIIYSYFIVAIRDFNMGGFPSSSAATKRVLFKGPVFENLHVVKEEDIEYPATHYVELRRRHGGACIRRNSNTSTDAALDIREACRALESSLRVYDREMFVDAQLIVSTYLKPGAEANSSLTNSVTSCVAEMDHLLTKRRESLIKAPFESSFNEFLSLLLLKSFPTYLQDEGLTDKCPQNQVEETPEVPESAQSHDDISGADIDLCIKSWQEYFIQNQTISNLFHFSNPKIIHDNLKQSSWLNCMKRILENLPVSASIADARAVNKGFPIIYVNKKFEKMTGFTFDQINGKNNKFLQGELTERKSVERLAEALQVAKPVKVQLTNYRSDGTPFLNLLSLTPVLDLNAKFCFVIGIQFDCSAPDVDVSTMHMVDIFISMLPTICISE